MYQAKYSSSDIKCVSLDVDQSTIVRLPNHFQAGNFCLVYHGVVIVSLGLQPAVTTVVCDRVVEEAMPAEVEAELQG